MTSAVSVTRGEPFSLCSATFCIHVFDLRSLYIRLGASMEKLLFFRLTELNLLVGAAIIMYRRGK